jgi:hypothetical protein
LEQIQKSAILSYYNDSQNFIINVPECFDNTMLRLFTQFFSFTEPLNSNQKMHILKISAYFNLDGLVVQTMTPGDLEASDTEANFSTIMQAQHIANLQKTLTTTIKARNEMNSEIVKLQTELNAYSTMTQKTFASRPQWYFESTDMWVGNKVHIVLETLKVNLNGTKIILPQRGSGFAEVEGYGLYLDFHVFDDYRSSILDRLTHSYDVIISICKPGVILGVVGEEVYTETLRHGTIRDDRDTYQRFWVRKDAAWADDIKAALGNIQHFICKLIIKRIFPLGSQYYELLSIMPMEQTKCQFCENDTYNCPSGLPFKVTGNTAGVTSDKITPPIYACPACYIPRRNFWKLKSFANTSEEAGTWMESIMEPNSSNDVSQNTEQS